MNVTNKPKRSAKYLINHLKNKGVTFKYISETDAEDFLLNRNNYIRTASYRKNYQKYPSGPHTGDYQNLDFSYLVELSIIDMHLRFIIEKMCSDIEHDLKVIIQRDIEQNTNEDGYSIVKNFLNSNRYILSKLEATSTSPFTSDLLFKYFTINTTINSATGKPHHTITGIDCPVWVLLELLSFGDFVRFYKYYYSKYGGCPIPSNIINLVRNLRNAAAHNSCIINDLNKGSSRSPRDISLAVQKIKNIPAVTRRKKLSTRCVLEFVSMLYVYNIVVSEKVKGHRIHELKNLFDTRLVEKKGFFKSNSLICTTFKFVHDVIYGFFPN